MKELTLSIPNISCHHCAHTIKMELGELEGMESVEVDVPSKKATFRYDSPATEAEIRKSLQDINYPAEN